MDVLARCSISELSTRHLAFADDLSLYQQRGWGGVNVWLHKLEDPPFATGYMPEAILSDETLDAARSAIDARRLAVPAVVVSGGFTLPGCGANALTMRCRPSPPRRRWVRQRS